jgi:hypothetical protein
MLLEPIILDVTTDLLRNLYEGVIEVAAHALGPSLAAIAAVLELCRGVGVARQSVF